MAWKRSSASLPEGASLSSRIGRRNADGFVCRALAARTGCGGGPCAIAFAGGSFVLDLHPKTTARILRSDFNQNDVRELALARGFVDYKVCCGEMTQWSGLKFARRKR